MTSCCQPLQYTFVNQSTLSIPWGAIQVADYGMVPNVQVYYQQNGEFVLSEDMNQVRFLTSSIEIDFGGPANGIVKVF